MNSNSTPVSESLLRSTKEPVRKFPSAILRFHLLIIFEIVADNKARAFSSPLTTADLLF